MPRLKPCSNLKHVWKRVGKSRFERCEICKTFFPCKEPCHHADCADARQEAKEKE